MGSCSHLRIGSRPQCPQCTRARRSRQCDFCLPGEQFEYGLLELAPGDGSVRTGRHKQLRASEVDRVVSVAFDNVADSAGVSIEEIQQLNPSLRRWVTPPARKGAGYKIKIPQGKTETFLAEFDGRSPDEITYRHHRVAHGETMKVLSKKFSLATESILQLNGVQNAKALKPGMEY